ncbi:MAG: DUF58 domain-containing protein [Verrucomicrobia bacterium]|nr:DUF58 domain-containing protein [Verrucomicrobiota bacterium]
MLPAEIMRKIRLLELRTRRLVSETMAGRYQSAFKGVGLNFEEVREYMPGDEVRMIDWNVTARMHHPYVKKFTEERELTVMLLVDLSGSGLFGSTQQTKRELAAEIASIMAFSAVHNNDKAGLVLFSDHVERFVPPRKGRRHVLRVIREILMHEPEGRGTDLTGALRFVSRVVHRRAIVVILSDLMGQTTPSRRDIEAHLRRAAVMSHTLGQTPLAALRQANRRHDVVAVQIVDRFELVLPALGRLMLKDAETGETVEVDTGDPRRRRSFAERQERAQAELRELFQAAGIDLIQLRTDESYIGPLARFFEMRERRRRHG